MSNENYLAHYGVKGMKWGRRKASAETKAKSRELRTQNRSIMRDTMNPFNKTRRNRAYETAKQANKTAAELRELQDRDRRARGDNRTRQQVRADASVGVGLGLSSAVAAGAGMSMLMDRFGGIPGTNLGSNPATQAGISVATGILAGVGGMVAGNALGRYARDAEQAMNSLNN